jgi:transcriptional regulator with XRE-family HTH domain
MIDQVDLIGQRMTTSGVSGNGRIETKPAAPDFSEIVESESIGEYLRRQRILRGVSIEELALATRIPLRSLERLEAGQFDGETDGFVRGFVRTVANALGLDAGDAISRMLREPEVRSWERRALSRSFKQASVGVALVLLLVVAFFALRGGWNLLLGTASTPASREVVLWRDPVRALAESRGFLLDGRGPQPLGGAVVRDVSLGSDSREAGRPDGDRPETPPAAKPTEAE